MAIQVSAEKRKEIIARLQSGEPAKQVREAFGIPHQTLAKIRRASGLLAGDQRPIRKQPAPSRRPSLEDVRQHVTTVIEGLEAAREGHLAKIKDIDEELAHARKILKSMD